MAGQASVQRLFEKTDYWGWVNGDLYLGKNDDGVAMRLHDGQPYEPVTRNLWRTLAAKAEIAVDIGAHTGLFTIEAFRAGAKEVLSIEPYHMNYARCVMNVRHAGFGTEGIVFCAAGERDETADFSVAAPNFYCSAGGSTKEKQKDAGVYPIVVRRLDSIVKEQFHDRIGVIKIDTEKTGAEILRGMPKILSHRPDLILECTEYGLAETLRPLGYRFYRIDEKAGLSEVDDLIPDNPFSFDTPNRYATVKEI